MQLTGIVNTTSPGFCSIFTFLFESCVGLCRFFVIHMNILCKLILSPWVLFYVFSVFCFLCKVLNHMHDAFVLILWTDDFQTLETLCDSPCHYEYLYQGVFLEAFSMLFVLTQNLLEILLESMHNVLFMLLQWIFILISFN